MIDRDLRCPKADSFHFTFIVRESINNEPGEPRDLTGWSAAGEVRDSLTDGILLATMEFTSTEQNLEDGQISMYIPAAIIADIPLGTYFYDIVLTDGTAVSTYFGGKFFVTPKVTQGV
jgi:hypothetical protein